MVTNGDELKLIQMADEITTTASDTNTPEGASSRIYELGYHLLASFAEAELPVEVAAIRSRVENHGGVFVADEFPHKMVLAYPMFRSTSGKRERFTEAYFGWLKFEMEPEEAELLNKELRDEKKLVRYILIKTIRENTLIPKRLLTTEREDNEALKKREISAPREAEVTGPRVSDEELDKTIEGLVVE